MSSLILTLGCAGFTAFTQRVFRPSALWARCLVLVLPGMMLGGFVTTGLHIGFDAARLSPDGGYYLFQGALLLSMGWCAVESIRVADSLRRRVRIGLADPVVANRVQLWGGAMIVATLMSGASLGGQLVGIDLIGSVAGLTFVGCFGSVAAGGIYLAFLPPAAYTRWISAAAARRS